MQMLEGLTERQIEAVLSEDVADITTAGAGAGKTSVLTRKIAKCLQKFKDSPLRTPVVAITFTRDAAKEMKSRIDAMVGEELASKVIGSTFHSFALNRIIKPNIAHPFFRKNGLKKLVTLASDRDVLHCMALALDKGLSSDQRKHLKSIETKPTFSEWLSLTRAFGYSTESYFANLKQSLPVDSIETLLARKERYSISDDQVKPSDAVNLYYLKAWVEYVKQLRTIADKGMIDFDEVLVLATHLLEQHKEVRVKMKALYRYFFVDEFQDTNNCQFRFIMALADDGRRLSMFGDVQQAIYGFRGSNPNLFAQIPKIFPHAKLTNLPDNFRSVEQVVAVGNALAANMRLKMTSEPMIARNTAIPIEPVTVMSAETEQTEAEWIATKMQWLHGKGIAYKDMTVLYRFRKLANCLENELISRGIPNRRVGGSEDKSLYEDPRIIDIVMYLHLLFNPTSKDALRRFLTENSQFGFSNQRYFGLMRKHQFQNHHHMLQHLLEKEFSSSHIGYRPLAELAKDALGFSAKLENLKTFESYCRACNIQYEGLAPLRQMDVIKQYGHDYMARLSTFVESLMKRYVAYFYLPFLTTERRDRSVKAGMERFSDDFRAVCSAMFSDNRVFTEGLNIHDYFCSRPLLSTNMQKNQEENETDVELMTAHASKGLEKEAVFVLGCNDETWFKDPIHPESPHFDEELRLFYVACTRAKRQLYLSHYRQAIKRNNVINCNPVSFLAMISAIDNIKHMRGGRNNENTVE